MGETGAGTRTRRAGRCRLRRSLAAVAATLAGAAGVIVATPQLASAAVAITVTAPTDGQHVAQFSSATVSGFCEQNGATAFVAACRVEVLGDQAVVVAAWDIPVGFHVNEVFFDEPLPTATPGAYTIHVVVEGTGDGVKEQYGPVYWVDAAPPSATVTSPGNGTAVNPGVGLSLAGFCTPGGLPLVNCYGQAFTPGGGVVDIGFPNGSLPTGTPGDYTARITASDGTTEVSAQVGYHVNFPPSTRIDSPTNRVVVNEGAALANEAYCVTGDHPLASCVETLQYPDLHTVQHAGGGNLPTVDYGWHVVTITATDAEGLSSTSQVSYRVNALPHADITLPAEGDRYYTGDAHPADYGCSDLEGLVSCVGNVGNGANVDTGAAGPKTFTVTATDNDGASTQASTHYDVYDRPEAHIDGPAIGTVINPGDPAPTFLGSCTGGMPATTCTMTVTRPGADPVDITDGQALPIDTYATYTIRVHIVDDLGTESEVTRTYKVNEPPHINVDVPTVEQDTFVGQDVDTIFDCYDNDGTVVTCDGADSPISISTDTPGHYTYDVLAVDDDGASTRAAVPYEVHPVVGPCRGRGIALLGSSYGDANPVSDPCAAATATSTSLDSIIGSVVTRTGGLGGLLGRLLAPLTNTVKAGVADGRTERTAPATFSASADVASARVNLIAGLTLEVTGVHSQASSTLTSCSTADRTGFSRVGTVKLNGVPIVVGDQPLTVPLLGLGTLYLNQRVLTPTGITQRALYLDLAGTALDVILGEATVNPYCG